MERKMLAMALANGNLKIW